MKTVKILLFASFGSHTFNDEAMKEMLAKTSKPKNRTGKIIEYLEKRGEVICRQNDGYWIKADDEFYFIAEVDTSRPWTISEYDGAEYIQYLDYKKIDPTLNYCTFNI